MRKRGGKNRGWFGISKVEPAELTHEVGLERDAVGDGTCARERRVHVWRQMGRTSSNLSSHFRWMSRSIGTSYQAGIMSFISGRDTEDKLSNLSRIPHLATAAEACGEACSFFQLTPCHDVCHPHRPETIVVHAAANAHPKRHPRSASASLCSDVSAKGSPGVAGSKREHGSAFPPHLEPIWRSRENSRTDNTASFRAVLKPGGLQAYSLFQKNTRKRVIKASRSKSPNIK